MVSLISNIWFIIILKKVDILDLIFISCVNIYYIYIYILAPNKGLETKSMHYLGAQRLTKAMLAAIYIYPVYVEYRQKFGVQIPKTPASHQGH